MRDIRTRKTTKTKKTAFVPRSLFVGVLITTSVIPLCACGGAVASSGKDSGVAPDAFRGGVAVRTFGDGGPDAIAFTVARCCFDATFGVAADAFAGVAADAFLGVAADAFFGVAADAFFGVADASFREDAPLGVAACCFDASLPPSQDSGK